jgi:hypothetical protein
MYTISSYIFVSGQLCLICTIAGVPLGAAVTWYLQYLRILLYVSRNHGGDISRLGALPLRMLYAHSLLNIGVVAGGLSLLFRPTLLPYVFLIFFILPLPLYFLIQRSVLNYTTKFWARAASNFGDAHLVKMRQDLTENNRKLLTLFIFGVAISLAIILFSIILRYAPMAVRNR